MANILKGVHKIAVLLAVLGEEESARVMGLFDDDERGRIGAAMAELEEAEVEEKVVESVIEEFRGMVEGGVVFSSSVGRTLGGVMQRLYGDDAGKKRLESIREEARSNQPFRGLRGIRATDVAHLLMDEHLQIQALVLSSIDSDQAAEILEEIDEKLRPDIVRRMATMEEPGPRIMKQVASAILARARGLRREEDRDVSESDGRLGTVADILNATEPGTDKEILKRMEEADELLGNQIRERMFTWTDLGLLDKRTMQKVLAGIDTKLLALALKSCDDEVRDALLGATSQRTTDMILEEKELLGSVPLADVLDAQKQILGMVRELMDSGEITVSKGRGAAYVQ